MLNPLTRRSILKGGRVYKRLLRKGIIKEEIDSKLEEKKETDDELIDLKKIDIVKEDDTENKNENKNENENENENEIEKNIDNENLSDIIAEASQKVMDNYKYDLEKIENDDDLYNEIKNKINDEIKYMINNI